MQTPSVATKLRAPVALACLAAAALAATGCGGGGKSTSKSIAPTLTPAQARAKGHAVRQSLPPPGQPAPASVRELVGVDSTGQYAIAIAADTATGGEVAYVTDGKKVARWFEGAFTGAKLQLTGPKGARFDATAISPSRIPGTATFGGRTVHFILQPARPRSGLRRVVAKVNGKRVEVGTVIDNGGRRYTAQSRLGG